MNVIPFTFHPSEVSRLARQWLLQLKLAPAGLKDVTLSDPHAVYIPYYRCDGVIKGELTGKVGRKVQASNDASPSVSWRATSETIHRDVSGVLVPATDAYDPWMLRTLAHYDVLAAEPGDVDGLAFNVDQEDALALFHDDVADDIKAAFRQRYDHTRDVQVHIDVSDATITPLLCPIYVLTYRHHLRTYTVLVNGQTASVTGQRPIAWLKAMRTVAYVMLPALILYWLNAQFPTLIVDDRGTSLLAALGFMALIGGGFLAILYVGFLVLTAINGGAEFESYLPPDRDNLRGYDA
jgi:hypothetical protein